MNPRRFALIAIVPALLALVAAGCGGTSDSGGSGGKVALVAYSTPQGGLRGAHPGVPEDRRRARASTFSQSYGASGDQSRAVEAGLPADVVAFSLAPDVDKLVKAGLVAPDWNKNKYERHGHELRRRVRRPQGQPEEHQDLGRPDQARRRGDHAEPVHLGRRALERDGRLRRPDRAGQDRAAGDGLPQGSCSRTWPCRTRAPARRCRRSSAARATCCSPTRTRRSPRSRRGQDARLRRPRPDDPDPEPDRGDDGRAAREGAGVRGLPAHAGGAEDLRRARAIARCCPARSTSRSSRSRRRCSRSTKLGGWTTVNDEFFDPDNGHHRGDREGLGVSTAK